MKRCTVCKASKSQSCFYRIDRTSPNLTARCKDCLRRIQRQYVVEHREEEKARKKKWEHAHRERLNAERRARYAQNPQPFRERTLRWRKAHPEQHLEICRHDNKRRRARKMNAGGSISLLEWNKLKAQYAYQCLACGKREPEITLTMDHVIPLVKGGRHEITNVQPLCRSCNSHKKTNSTDFRNGRQPQMQFEIVR